MWFTTELCRTNESMQPAVWSQMTASGLNPGSTAWFELRLLQLGTHHHTANPYLLLQSKLHLIPQAPQLRAEEEK